MGAPVDHTKYSDYIEYPVVTDIEREKENRWTRPKK